MAYASQAGMARTNPSNPQAHAICDRCGFRYNWVDLKWQMDWRGAALQNLRILVCSDCYDTPQEQLRAIVVPADPTPIINARVQDFVAASAGSATGLPYGQPTSLSQQGAIMPLQNGVTYGKVIPVLSVTANGTITVTVTCSANHGLATGAQISVEGLTIVGATGMYSITFKTNTSFTYNTYAAVPSGPLQTSTTRMVTAIVGLPYGYTTIPEVGP